MLVDLTPIESEIERCTQLLQTHFPELSKDKYYLYMQSDPRLHLETGFYVSPSGNFGFNFFLETHESCKSYGEFWYSLDEETGEFVHCYGVADNLQQIKEYFSKQIHDPENRYWISIHYISQNKERAGKGGGWRWHKWGPYIGNLEPKCEYLDDEDFGPDFSGHVICFHCYKLN